MTPPGPVLLYDGTCGFCSATVRFVLRHDRRGSLRFAPLDGSTAGRLAGRHPQTAGADSVVWWEPAGPRAGERVSLRSDAVLRLCRYLGGWWRIAGLARIIPRALRDRTYDWVARHRHRLPGAAACVVIPPEVRARFLE